MGFWGFGLRGFGVQSVIDVRHVVVDVIVHLTIFAARAVQLWASVGPLDVSLDVVTKFWERLLNCASPLVEVELVVQIVEAGAAVVQGHQFVVRPHFVNLLCVGSGFRATITALCCHRIGSNRHS